MACVLLGKFPEERPRFAVRIIFHVFLVGPEAFEFLG
jgi:hypothetical protein